jgi:hypothetical protein
MISLADLVTVSPVLVGCKGQQPAIEPAGEIHFHVAETEIT